MKRTAFVAAILAALFLTQGTASADGYRDGHRMHRHPGVWTGPVRHMARHHGDWRWRRAGIVNQDNAGLAGYRAAYHGSRYYGADYDSDYGYSAAPRYGYPASFAYSGCSGCAPAYPSCYSYGCRPAYSACGYYGGCGGWMGYSRCGGC
jgi:hypothetical protein